MPSALERLDQVKAEIELQVAEAQLESIKRQRGLVTASLFQETGEQFGDPHGYLFDDPRWPQDPRIYGGHVSRLEDRANGSNWPFFQSEEELSQIRGDARLLAGVNEVGIGAINVLTNFTIGTGFEYDLSAKTKKDIEVALYAQAWIDEFDERVAWREVEREFHNRALVDGEAFLHLQHLGGGRSDACFIEPDAVTEPADRRGMDEYAGHYALNWLFGIATEPGNPARVHGYFLDRGQQNWDYVSNFEVVHGKRNVVRNVKRGLSDLYAVGAELRRADKILRNTGEGAALQSAIAWIREHPMGTTGAQVLSLTSGKTHYEIDQTTPEGNTRTWKYQRYLPGTILDVKAGQIYKPGPMGTGAMFIDVSQAILRYVAVRWNMPDWLISSDSSTSNFASVLVTESPFVKAVETDQCWFVDIFRKTKWKILEVAVRAGRFARFGISDVRDLRRSIEIDILPPRVSTRNRLEETKIRSMLYEYGLLSRQSWSAKEELNFEHEQANLASEPPIGQTQQASQILRRVGLGLGFGDKLFQPQAEEPGNVGQMPEMGQKPRTTATSVDRR